MCNSTDSRFCIISCFSATSDKGAPKARGSRIQYTMYASDGLRLEHWVAQQKALGWTAESLIVRRLLRS